MTHNEMLDYEYPFADTSATTLREYFYTLLDTLWCEGEGFSGKRPFGNSGWEYSAYEALVAMDAIEGEFEVDPDNGTVYGLSGFDKTAAYALVPELIKTMCFGSVDG